MILKWRSSFVCWCKSNDEKSNISSYFIKYSKCYYNIILNRNVVEIIKIALIKRNCSIIKSYSFCLPSKFIIYLFLYQFFTICTYLIQHFSSFFFSLTLSLTLFSSFALDISTFTVYRQRSMTRALCRLHVSHFFR